MWSVRSHGITICIHIGDYNFNYRKFSKIFLVTELPPSNLGRPTSCDCINVYIDNILVKEMTPQRDDVINSCDVVLYDSLIWRFVTLFSLFVLVSYPLPLSCHDRKLRAFLRFLAHLESSKSVQNWRSYTCLKSTCLARQLSLLR